MSLGLVKKVDMNQYTYKELIKDGVKGNLIRPIDRLTTDLFEHGSNERVTLMPFLENRPFPAHPKFKGTISVSKKAFKHCKNNQKLENPEYEEEIQKHISKFSILYLPNL